MGGAGVVKLYDVDILLLMLAAMLAEEERTRHNERNG